MLKIGVTLPQATRSCGNLDPTNNKVQLVRIKRTPRCFKLFVKRTSIAMQDIEWQNPPLAPPQI
jgi:hypothetical protein|tara:strand:+ start:1236 stop:1427 length:192 start_codon:yes stop_codon:yes gene_type:complete